MVQKQDIINDLLDVKNKLGKIPGGKTYDKLGKHCLSTVIKIFGSWSKACEMVFNIEPKINKPKSVVLCANCAKETTNPKFCCKSCTATYINKHCPKRQRKYKPCKKCQTPIFGYRRKYCHDCKKIITRNFLSDTITLGEAAYKKHHKSSAFALVRARARAIGKTFGMAQCTFCGYSKHVEICHKKSISSFSLDSTLLEINDPKNLFPACPNCHWEYDHGLLTIPVAGIEPALIH